MSLGRAVTPSREGQGSGNETSGADSGASSEDMDEAGGGNTVSMAFADENGPDPEDVYAKADGIKVPYCKTDPIYWFRRLEIQMQIRKIKSQFWKRVVLEANLPPEVNETIKDLLIKEENDEDAGTVYRDCKARILKVFGPKPEQDFTLALGMVMEGLPSQAAKRVKDLVCKRNFDCCCPAVVGKIWRDMLPEDVRLAVASHNLKTQWDGALDMADNVYYALKAGAEVAAVKLDETAPDETAPALHEEEI